MRVCRLAAWFECLYVDQVLDLNACLWGMRFIWTCVYGLSAWFVRVSVGHILDLDSPNSCLVALFLLLGAYLRYRFPVYVLRRLSVTHFPLCTPLRLTLYLKRKASSRKWMKSGIPVSINGIRSLHRQRGGCKYKKQTTEKRAWTRNSTLSSTHDATDIFFNGVYVIKNIAPSGVARAFASRGRLRSNIKSIAYQ